MKIRYLFMLLCFLVGGSVQGVYAQEAIVKAVVDNYIVPPLTTMALNVLKNDEVSCNIADITVAVSTAPGHGTATVRPNKTINYRVTNGYYGSDSFQYTITCDGKTSTATVYISCIANVPDNMMPDVCAITPPEFDWKIRIAQTSNLDVIVARPWLVGNLGGTSKPEIVCQGSGNYSPDSNVPAYWTTNNGNQEYSNKITIFHDGNLAAGTEYQVKPYSPYYNVCQFGLSKYSNGNGAVIIPSIDGKVYGYEYDGATKTLKQRWASTVKFIHEIHTVAPNAATNKDAANIHSNGPSVGFADFNKDGKIEVYIGNKIYDLETGAYLCGGDATHRGFSLQNNQSKFGGMLSVAVDFDLDGQIELVCGNAIYKPTYNSATTTWSMSKIQTIAAPVTGFDDGHVSLVDLNDDGYPDAVIQSNRRTATEAAVLVYGWDMKNNKILFRYHQTGAATPANRGVGTRSVAFIGDIDGDGKPEIAFIEEWTPQVSRDALLKAYKLPTTFSPTASLQLFWQMGITEAAGRTGVSLFDFNLDGISEVLYRDETQLRIIDGSLKKQNTPYNLAAIPSVSATTWEMPVVADIDGDGAAEIICAGAEEGVAWTSQGKMKIFKSGNSSQWAPSRTVWNQYAYNPTFVNEDLTIPRFPVNMASYFHGADGVTRRPYNNFLQQAPIMTSEGVSLHVAPNLKFNPNSQPTLHFNESTGAATVSCSILNDGDLPFVGPITLLLYAYDEASSEYLKVGTRAVIGNATSTLGINGTQMCTFTINNFLDELPSDYTSWFLVINSIENGINAPTYYYGMEECIEADNQISSLSLVREERVMCEGNTEKIHLPETYSYRWYTSINSNTPVATASEGSHVMEHTKNNDQVEYYFVESYLKNNYSKIISQVRDTIFVYLAPDSLIWTGAESEDWHDFNNWENPNDIYNEYPHANVPRLCTNVLINDCLTRYPILSDGKTLYNKYPLSESHNIHFKHGGEVSQPDSLIYTNAFVEVDIQSNRWVMFSPPLKHLYSGDIYVKDKNPYNDDVFVGTRLFAQKNPQTGHNQGSWTGKYNNPEVSFNAGEGLAVWLDDKDYTHDPLNIPHDPFLFKFPKYDTMHHIYDQWGIPEKNIPITKGLEHRFIFDELPSASNKNFTIKVDDKTGDVGGDKYVLVGNPFMAHLDFNKFYTANSTSIYSTYQLIDENGDTKTYAGSGGTLDQYIPPMQSFLVRLRSSVSTLVMNGNMTANVPGHKLRSATVLKSDADTEDVLFINLANGTNNTNIISSASVILKDGAKNSYNAEEDVPKLLFTYEDYLIEPSGIYTEALDDNKIKLAINKLDASTDSLRIPLGIRSVKANQDLAFYVQGQWSFALDKPLYLHDKLTETYYDLRNASWYYFKNADNQPYLDRFAIVIGSKGISGVVESENVSTIKISGAMNAIHVESEYSISEINVYDLQGKLIASRKNQENDAKIELIASGIYVVEVVTSNDNHVEKIFVY